MGHTHLGMVGGEDHQSVVDHSLFLESVQHPLELLVRGDHEIAVEVQVIALLVRREAAEAEVGEVQELLLDVGLVERSSSTVAGRSMSPPRHAGVYPFQTAVPGYARTS